MINQHLMIWLNNSTTLNTLFALVRAIRIIDLGALPGIPYRTTET